MRLSCIYTLVDGASVVVFIANTEPFVFVYSFPLDVEGSYFSFVLDAVQFPVVNCVRTMSFTSMKLGTSLDPWRRGCMQSIFCVVRYMQRWQVEPKTKICDDK